MPFSSKKASARNVNSSGATGHLIGISQIWTTSLPPSQVLSFSPSAVVPSKV